MVGVQGSKSGLRAAIQARLASALALFAILGAALTLGGWAFDQPRLTDWFGLGISMQPNTAAGVLCIGLAILGVEAARPRAALAFAGVAIALGGLTLFEHATKISVGIDGLLLTRDWGATATVAPGRIGVPASVSLVLLGLALAMQAGGRRPIASAVPAILAITIALFSIVGYLFGTDVLYAVPRTTAVALQSAVLLLSLAAGVLCLPGMRALVPWERDSAAGTLFSRSWPALVALPIAVGWLCVLGARAGSFDPPFAVAVVVLSLIVLFSVLLWLALSSLAQHEREVQANAARIAVSAERLRQSEERMQLAMSIANAATWDADARSGRAQWSRSHFTLLGYEPTPDGAADDQMWIAALHPEDRARVLASWRAAVAAGERFESEHRFVNQATGQVLWAKAAGRFFPGEDGALRSLGVFFETTELKRTEHELARMAAESNMAHRNKDLFLATLAHELRNPLAALVTGLDVLDRGGASPELGARVIPGMRRQATQLTRLVDDLLDASRITSNKLELRIAPIDLGLVLQQALDTAQAAARARDIRIVAELGTEPLSVRGDAARLVQVFSNLLNNACKFSPAGSTVTLAARSENGRVFATVRDEGIGIAADALPQVFDLFFQAGEDRHGGAGGMGIGLALVRDLVQMHGGRVRAASDGPGKGSSFEVELPLVDPVHALDPDPAQQAADGDALTGKRVLIVDDNPDVIANVHVLVRLLGALPQVATDGRQAVRLARDHVFDYVFLDIGLPEVDGYEACRQIRAEGASRNATIVAISGWGTARDVERALAAGFDAHMVKPVDTEALLRTVKAKARSVPSA
jgi:PAS domain S-box-containing protein